jgi:1,2-diacylglycerol 3-beta-galactosyltransferase
MILHPRFYAPLDIDRAAERTRLGLDPHLPAALVLFGGYGSGAIRTIAEELDAAPLDLQLILICGRNEKLRQALAARRFRRPVLVEGFTTNVPYYMALADFLIGKPGPGSISEALHMGLPVITVSNAFTLPQERFNAQWLTRHNLGIVMPGYAQVRGAASLLLTGSKLDEFRANAGALQNRAVFEIPAILDTILNRSHT